MFKQYYWCCSSELLLIYLDFVYDTCVYIRWTHEFTMINLFVFFFFHFAGGECQSIFYWFSNGTNPKNFERAFFFYITKQILSIAYGIRLSDHRKTMKKTTWLKRWCIMFICTSCICTDIKITARYFVIPFFFLDSFAPRIAAV